MSRSLFELMDDMHLSAQSTFLDYYNAMSANNVELAQQILDNNPELADQITNSENINRLIDGINKNEEQPSKDIDDKLDKLEEDFQKLVDDTEEIGVFSSTTQYYGHNFVTYQGKHYFAKSTPPIGTLPTNTNYWQVYDIKGFQGFGGISNLNYRGNWDSTVDYNPFDAVVFQNKMWFANTANKNYAPNLNNYPWRLIAAPAPNVRTPIQKSAPLYGYNTGDFWFEVTEGEDVSLSSWISLPSDPVPTFASISFVANNIIYVVGGTNASLVTINKTTAFDIATNTWSTKANYPEVLDDMAAFTINNVGYCLGGQNSQVVPQVYSKSVYSYSASDNKWTKKKDFPVSPAIINGGMVANNKGYVFVGTAGIRTITSIYKYEETTDSWTKEADITNPMISPTGQVIGNNLYVIGGTSISGNILNTVYVYNLTNKTWSQGKNMTTARSYTSSFIGNNQIYVAGGTDALLYSTDIVERYNPQNNTWSAQSPLQFARNSLCAVSNGNYGYVMDGINFMQPMIGGFVERFDFSTNA